MCRPIKRRRLVIPLIIAAGMLALLVYGVWCSLGEVFKYNNYVYKYDSIFFAVNWIIWGGVFYLYTRNKDRFTVIKNLTGAIVAGSVLELIAAIPAHLFVTRKPGCLVGIDTGIGLIAGIYVMLFAFGPGVVLLSFRPKSDKDTSATP